MWWCVAALAGEPITVVVGEATVTGTQVTVSALGGTALSDVSIAQVDANVAAEFAIEAAVFTDLLGAEVPWSAVAIEAWEDETVTRDDAGAVVSSTGVVVAARLGGGITKGTLQEGAERLGGGIVKGSLQEGAERLGGGITKGTLQEGAERRCAAESAACVATSWTAASGEGVALVMVDGVVSLEDAGERCVVRVADGDAVVLEAEVACSSAAKVDAPTPPKEFAAQILGDSAAVTFGW